MAGAAAPRLFDHTGTEIPLSGPKQPPGLVPLPGVDSSATDRYRLYPTKNLRPERIVQILEAADAGDPFQLVQFLEDMLDKDPKLASVFQTRTAAISGLDFDCAPPKLENVSVEEEALADEIARFCYQMLDAVNFGELVGDLMDAVCKPFAVDWIEWGENSDGRIVASRFRRIPPTHIRWAFDTDTIRIYDPSRPTFTGTDFGTPLPPFQTVRALYQAKRDHPTRAGIGRSLIWPFHFKTTVTKDMVSYADRYGMPPRVLKVDDTDFSSPERRELFRQSMMDFGHDLSAVISKNSELDIKVVATKDGIEVYIGQIEYFDKLYAWAVLGHELSSQSSPGSGQNGITAALQVRQDLLESDCNWIAAIIKRDILSPVVGWNFGWDRISLTPNLQFDYQPPRDLQVDANVLSTVFRTFPGLTGTYSQVRDTFGIQAPAGQPDPEDDVLRPGASGGAVAAGASAAVDPLNPDGTSPDAGPATVNSARAPGGTLTVTGSPVAETQKAIDELARRGTRATQATSEVWARKLREILRASAEEGLTLEQTRRRIVQAYPELDVEDLDRTLREQRLLSRLAGRNL